MFIHPDLFSGPWYAEQDGGTSRSGYFCTRADIGRFVAMTRDHEFTSNDSHLSRWNAALANLDLQGRVEGLRLYNQSVSDLQLRATATAKRIYDDIGVAERAWDNSVYSGIYHRLGCDFDFVIGDGK